MTPARDTTGPDMGPAPSRRPRVVVAGLGPAGPELVTAQVRQAVAGIPERWLRTTRHPSAAVVTDPAGSYDELYEQLPTFDQIYAAIVSSLVERATAAGEVLYAVPGSPLVAERTVELLLADGRVDVEVLAGLSFLDLAWARLGVDPLARGVRLVDGADFARSAAGERGPLLVAQCWSREILSAIKLSIDDPDGADPGPVTVLHHLGLADERVDTVPWAELDRAVAADHLTSLWIPQLAVPVSSELTRFAELVRTLRARCPWDRQQTHASLRRHLIEETYEVVEAIDEVSADPAAYPHLEEELGDLLFQVVFHATLAAEAGEFTLADVARGVHDKLVRRHPHVFGEVEAATAGEVAANWEEIKRAEKGRTRVLDGIPAALPSLLYAWKVQRKAAAVGFDWPTAEGPRAKVVEELDELDGAGSEPEREDELGDLLFAVVNLARHLEVDPETALRAASAKFRRRFEQVEAAAAARGLDLAELDLAALDALWDEAKGRPS